MIKELIRSIKNIDKKALKIMIKGLKFSFSIYILSAILLLSHIISPSSHIIYDCGIILFKTALTFSVAFFVCAFATDKIKKELI